MLTSLFLGELSLAGASLTGLFSGERLVTEAFFDDGLSWELEWAGISSAKVERMGTSSGVGVSDACCEAGDDDSH